MDHNILLAKNCFELIKKKKKYSFKYIYIHTHTHMYTMYFYKD